jgi:hypothetical protein
VRRRQWVPFPVSPFSALAWQQSGSTKLSITIAVASLILHHDYDQLTAILEPHFTLRLRLRLRLQLRTPGLLFGLCAAR